MGSCSYPTSVTSLGIVGLLSSASPHPSRADLWTGLTNSTFKMPRNGITTPPTPDLVAWLSCHGFNDLLTSVRVHSFTHPSGYPSIHPCISASMHSSIQQLFASALLPAPCWALSMPGLVSVPEEFLLWGEADKRMNHDKCC